MKAFVRKDTINSDNPVFGKVFKDYDGPYIEESEDNIDLFEDDYNNSIDDRFWQLVDVKLTII